MHNFNLTLIGNKLIMQIWNYIIFKTITKKAKTSILRKRKNKEL